MTEHSSLRDMHRTGNIFINLLRSMAYSRNKKKRKVFLKPAYLLNFQLQQKKLPTAYAMNLTYTRAKLLASELTLFTHLLNLYVKWQRYQSHQSYLIATSFTKVHPKLLFPHKSHPFSFYACTETISQLFHGKQNT